jgi:peptide-O-fucosyltransferase
MRTAAVGVLMCALWTCLPPVAATTRGTTKYLIYTVKSGEGFNLRRDVHMRAATLLRLLQEQSVGGTGDWILVLPPWPRLYHWRSASRDRVTFVPWAKFFDLPSLNLFVPTIEFDEYLQRNGHTIDEVMVLQNFEGEFTVDDFGKIEEQLCLGDQYRYERVSGGRWKGRMFGVEGLSIKIHRCISAMGHISLILPYLRQLKGNSMLVENFEILLHERYGDTHYWQSRYSMVYAKHLREAGNRFMSETLDYRPNEGGVGRQPAKDGGGKYISIHLRRQDYLYAHKDVVPSLEGAASQLNTLKKELGLETVFLASDSSVDGQWKD